jgi:hypothetical protein
MRVGTPAWARATGGRLGFADRLQLARAAAANLVRELPDLVTHRLGLKRRYPAPVDVDRLLAPDTHVAKTAETLLAELAPAYMVNHSLRTYWFARLLGLGASLRFDDEALYVASLLHDAGFFGRYATAAPEAECFAIRGANAALELLRDAGWDAARRERVAETIILHVNGTVPPEQGIEAYLMERGVLLDTTGLYAWDLNPSCVTRVFEQHPLLDQREQLWPLFSREAHAHPRCRGRFAERYLQFGLLIRLSPWR